MEQRLIEVLERQSQALLTVAKSQQGRSAADPLSLLAEGDSWGGSSGLRLPGARGAAAMELLRTDLRERPAAATALVRRNRREQLTGSGDEGGLADTTTNYLTRMVPFGQAKSAAYMAYGVAAAFDAMERGNNGLAEAHLALLLCATEQAAQREWRWNHAWLLTCLPDPPFQQIRATPDRHATQPLSRLTPPSWLAAVVAYARDVTILTEAERNPPRRTEDPPGEKANPKGRPWAKGTPPTGEPA